MAEAAHTYPPAAPYLMVRRAQEAIGFYQRAFGAVETELYDHEGRMGPRVSGLAASARG
jgi:uncharacterized glyoxalase superfamily protein PhnB